MRLPEAQATFIKQSLIQLEPGSQVYLFGSRVDDNAKGGDIDILWLTPKSVQMSRLRMMRVAFFRQFGWQKLDIVNFAFDAAHPFKDIALKQAQSL